jgi:hypothetical protein
MYRALSYLITPLTYPIPSVNQVRYHLHPSVFNVLGTQLPGTFSSIAIIPTKEDELLFENSSVLINQPRLIPVPQRTRQEKTLNLHHPPSHPPTSLKITLTPHLQPPRQSIAYDGYSPPPPFPPSLTHPPTPPPHPAPPRPTPPLCEQETDPSVPSAATSSACGMNGDPCVAQLHAQHPQPVEREAPDARLGGLMLRVSTVGRRCFVFRGGGLWRGDGE